MSVSTNLHNHRVFANVELFPDKAAVRLLILLLIFPIVGRQSKYLLHL